MDPCRSRDGCVNPAGVQHLLPQRQGVTQVHATDQAVGKCERAASVASQNTLQGQEANFRGGVVRQRCGKEAEHVPYQGAFLARIVGPVAPCSAPACVQPVAKSRGRYHRGMAHGSGARRARVSKPPDSPRPLADQDEQERAVAPAMTRVPAAPPFMALAGPQVSGEERASGMPGEMRERCRSCAWALQRTRPRPALRADEEGPFGVGAQLDGPCPRHPRVRGTHCHSNEPLSSPLVSGQRRAWAASPDGGTP